MVKINTKKNCKNFLKTVDVNLEYISVTKHWSEKKKKNKKTTEQKLKQNFIARIQLLTMQ